MNEQQQVSGMRNAEALSFVKGKVTLPSWDLTRCPEPELLAKGFKAREMP